MTIPLACRALLFDADGVLVDSDASVLRSWTRWAERWGLSPEDVYGTVHGRRSADTVALLIPPIDQQAALADIDRFEIEDAEGVTACPGAPDILACLPAASWAVVTSGTRALATARLTAAGLPRPSVLISADDVEAGKPDPAGYLAAASELGVPIEECLVLEDSPAGLAAGVAAGAQVLGISDRALAAGASIVVRDLAGCTWMDGALHVDQAALLSAGSEAD